MNMLYEQFYVEYDNDHHNHFGSNYLEFVHINLSTFND